MGLVFRSSELGIHNAPPTIYDNVDREGFIGGRTWRLSDSWEYGADGRATTPPRAAAW